MTDGTSQGLFIVVAIVIFGIFVVLAYILFEDTLSPAMASMFSNATEQARIDTSVTNGLTIHDLRLGGKPSDNFTVHSRGRNSIVFSSEDNSEFGSGVFIGEEYVEKDRKYRWEFDFTVLEGTVTRMGGHNHVSENKIFYIDGERFHTIATTIPYEFENNRTYKIVMELDSKKMKIDEHGNKLSTQNSGVQYYMQPNRGSTDVNPFKVEMKNMRFYEVR